MNLLDRLLGRGEDDDGPTWEYHLLKDSPPPKETVDVFDRPVSREYVEYHLDLDPGRYHLQQVDEGRRWGESEWSLEVEETEEDRLEAEVAELRASIEAAQQDDDGADARPSFPDDPEKLSSTLLGELASQQGASAALDRLERLEAAKSGADDLVGSVNDPTNRDEVVNTVLLRAFEKYGDDVGQIVEGLKMLGGQDQIDPNRLAAQIDARADDLGIEPDSSGSRSAVADGSGEPDEPDEETMGSTVRQRLEGEVEEYIDENEIDEEDEPDEGDEENP